MLTVRFQADADLKQAIVAAVLRREPTVDFQTANAVGLKDVDDFEVLAIAANENRVLVSHDKRTMPHHFAEFIAVRTSPGVVIVPQSMRVAEAVEELLLIWYASTPEEWTNRIVHLPM